jgi:glycosyltransferase involved in cell wall biosynthesis
MSEKSIQHPNVSVAMITYNQEPFIAKAIEGVLDQQTDFSVKLVIGEDFSTDKTREICLSYQEKFPDKVKVLKRKGNLGMMRNFVDTLQSCQGEFIALCEGDDYWTDPHKLQKQIDFLESNPDFSICFHPVKIIYEDENQKTKTTNIDQAVVTTFENLALDNYIHTVSCVFRNNSLTYPEWFYKMPAGDYVLHLLNAEHGKIGFINDVMAVYRVHKGGAWSMKELAELYAKWIPLVKQCREHFYPRGETEFTKQLANSYKQLCFAYFDAGRYKDFLESFQECAPLMNHLETRVRLSLNIRYFLSCAPRFADLYKNAVTSLRAGKA